MFKYAYVGRQSWIDDFNNQLIQGIFYLEY
jgi:hypothetical protein